jgi:hypothetical protein
MNAIQPEPQPHLWDGTPMAAMQYSISKENQVPTNHDEPLCGERELALLDEIDRLKAENAGLRKDAERYQWLCTNLGETQLPTLIERITKGYVADYKPSIDAAIDAAKGDSHE